jgi:predicted ATP-dependent serine protease
MPDDMIEVGGFTRKCVDIVAGPPGSGKTYSRNVLAAKAKIFVKREYGIDIRVGFISAEMRESEWAEELKQCELLKEIEVDYMLNYVGYSNYEDIFWEAFGDYDIVIVDSFPAVISHIKMSPNERRTDKIIVFDFIRKALESVEKNNNNVQLINQANKDGDYKGGTELPHMMSSMSFVKTEGSARYMQFIKNRNNGTTINRKVYFEKDVHGDIVFNEESYAASYEQVLDKKQNLTELFQSFDKNKMNGVGNLSANETAPEILNESIPAHLREESVVGQQRDLEDQIREEEEALISRENS